MENLIVVCNVAFGAEEPVFRTLALYPHEISTLSSVRVPLFLVLLLGAQTSLLVCVSFTPMVPNSYQHDASFCTNINSFKVADFMA